jgi:hypothetical protein
MKLRKFITVFIHFRNWLCPQPGECNSQLNITLIFYPFYYNYVQYFNDSGPDKRLHIEYVSE